MTESKCEVGTHNYTTTNSHQDPNSYTVLQMTCTKCGDIINPNTEAKD